MLAFWYYKAHMLLITCTKAYHWTLLTGLFQGFLTQFWR